MTLDQKISEILLGWQSDLSHLPNFIIALNIGIQERDSGVFELYLDGYDWFESGNDSWIIDDKWASNNNFIEIDKAEYAIERLALIAKVQEVFKAALSSNWIMIPKQVQCVTLTAGGKPTHLYTA